MPRPGKPQLDGTVQLEACHAPATWQVFMKGRWEQMQPDDVSRLEHSYIKGDVFFQSSLFGRACSIVLEGETWTYIDVSGTTHPIRRCLDRSKSASRTHVHDFSTDLGPCDEAHAAAPSVFKKCKLAHSNDPQPRTEGPIDVPTGIDYDRFFVWRSNDWHPVSESQCQQMRKHLGNGSTVFDIHDGPYTWTIDTSGKNTWVQISKTTGRQRTMKCQQGGPLSSKAGCEASIANISGCTRSMSRNNLQLPGCGGLAVSGCRIAHMQHEWHLIQHASGVSSSCNSLTMGDLIQAWVNSSSFFGSEFKELMGMSIADIFLKMDISRRGKIEESEWLHYWLLQQQAPSSHALLQVNETLLEFKDPQTLARLNKLFLETSGNSQDAQLTCSQMKTVMAVWLAKQRSGVSVATDMQKDLVAYLEEALASKDLIDEDEPLSYYDFMNHMLGRRKVQVQLYHYDLSNGHAKWLSPLLVGKQLEGVWHTSIVAYGREYWYGGQLFESSPGTTPFGAPTKIVNLPEQTMRTQADFVTHMRRHLVQEFTLEKYDVLTCNCNHFTDAACLFLLNCHIPEDVRTQPELVLDTSSWTMRLLRPVLNHVLGGFECSGVAKEPDCHRQEQVLEAGAVFTKSTLVMWEYDEGWTRLAYVFSNCTTNRTCVLKWIDLHTGEVHTESGVHLCSLQKVGQEDPSHRAQDLMLDAKARRAHADLFSM